MIRLRRTKPADEPRRLSDDDVRLIIRNVKACEALSDKTEPSILIRRGYGVHPSGFAGMVETYDEHPAHAMERMLRGEL